MRKLTRERAEALRLADGFSGLPPGTGHLELWDWINDARAPLGLTSDEISLLGYYFKRSRAGDWLPGREPVVAWPRFEVCFDLDWTEDKLARIENALCDKHLVAFRDRPDCKRHLSRDRTGRIAAHSTGISLAPAGSRAPEIRALAFQHREDRRALRRLFGDLFQVRAALRAAEGHPDLSGPAAAAVHDMLGAMPLRRDPGTCPTLLSALLERARAMLGHLRAVIGLPVQADGAVDRTPGMSLPSGDDNDGVRSARNERDRFFGDAASPLLLHRRDAAQQDPDPKNHSDNQKIMEELTNAPEMFRMALEMVQERGRGLPWDMLLEDALQRYGSDLGMQGRHVNRMKEDFGLVDTLGALFRLGRMIEKGAPIRNPAGYVVSIIRQRRGRSRIGPKRPECFVLPSLRYAAR